MKAADSPSDAFKREWKGRKIVLIEPLYTIQYPSVGALSPGEVSTRSARITIANPEKGITTMRNPSGVRIADPDRLIARVTAATANQKLESFSGANKRNVTAAQAVLLTYKPGTRMTVADLYMRDQWVRLDLDDDFYTKGPHTTALLVEWSQRIKKEFEERAAVEKLIAKFLSIR